MSEVIKIFLTSSLTIIGGLIIYAFTQIASKFFIEPIHEQKKIIGEILGSVLHQSILCSVPDGKMSINKAEAAQKIMILAKELLWKTQLIPCYSLLERMGIVSPMKNIIGTWQEMHNLIDYLLSPSSNYDNLIETVGKIGKVLNFKIFNLK
jgi:hypothetical protein